MARSSPLLSQISDTFQIIPACEHTEDKSGWEKVIGGKTNIKKMELWNNLRNGSRRLWNQIVCCSIKGMSEIKDLSLILTYLGEQVLTKSSSLLFIK